MIPTILCSVPPLSRSQTLGGLFVLTWCSSRALYTSPHAEDTIKCALLGAGVPGHCQEQLAQTSIVCLLTIHLFSLFAKMGWASDKYHLTPMNGKSEKKAMVSEDTCTARQASSWYSWRPSMVRPMSFSVSMVPSRRPSALSGWRRPSLKKQKITT